MSTSPEELTLDLDALDAAAAKKPDDKGKTVDSDPAVIVDPEVGAKTGDQTTVTPEQGLEKLKQQLADEKNARIAAEQRAADASRGEAAARGDVQKSQLDLLQGAIDQATQQSDVLEKQYADAAASGDWAAAGKAQREMAKTAARLERLEAGKTALENAPKPTPRVSVDPVEQWVTNIGPKYPRSQQWVREHPDFARDPRKQQQMIAAHELALARGYTAETDEYFKSIEKTLDLTPAVTAPAHVDDPDPLADLAATTATGGRSAAPAAAPVSRSGNGAAGRPNVVKLTPEEVEMARNMFPESKDPTLEYARNKAALRKEGKLS
jgi:hypothetical protein